MSWNCGAEGPTDDPEVNALRSRQQRNFLATLLLSQGVPMIAHGDEMGRTQQGNNNVYCQDNELSWMNWKLDESQQSLLEFTKKVISLRAAHPVFRRRRFFAGTSGERHDSPIPDIAWFTPAAEPMTGDAWNTSYARAIAVFLNGDAIIEPDEWGNPIVDDSFIMLFNAGGEPITFTLPPAEYGTAWTAALDADHSVEGWQVFAADTTVTVAAHSLVVLSRPSQPAEESVATVAPDASFSI